MSRSGQRSPEPVNDQQEINRRLRKLERRRGVSPTSASSATGLDTFSAVATGEATTSLGVVTTIPTYDMTWSSVSGSATADGSELLVAGGYWLVSGLATVTWSADPGAPLKVAVYSGGGATGTVAESGSSLGAGSDELTVCGITWGTSLTVAAELFDSAVETVYLSVVLLGHQLSNS